MKPRILSNQPVRLLFASLVLGLGAAGCSSDGDNNPDTDNNADGIENADNDANSPDAPDENGTGPDGSSGPVFAFVSGATPTFDAGQIERLSLADSITSSGTYPATLSDIIVQTDGTDVYQIGRFSIDSITRFTTDELATPVYQYSVASGDVSPNTFDMVFANENKAYVLQEGGSSVLIVNPAAETAESFITGSLDISAYDADVPNAVSAVIANGKLFVLLQRLTAFDPDKPGYVAVFDVETDEEIATGMNSEGLNGIALSTNNASSLQYVANLGEVVVNGRGNIFGEFNEVPGDPYTGGIETIDVESYSVDLLVDDGNESDNNDFFLASHVSTAERGYIITSGGYQNNTLRSYNPTTGVVDEGAVAGLEAQDLIAVTTGPQGRVWVAVGGTEPGFVLLNPADNSVAIEKVATQFVPNRVVFVSN